MGTKEHMNFAQSLYLEGWVCGLACLVYLVRIYRKTRSFVDIRLAAVGALFYLYALPGILASFSNAFADAILPIQLESEYQILLLVSIPLAFAAFFIGVSSKLRFRQRYPSSPSNDPYGYEDRELPQLLFSGSFLIAALYGIEQQLMSAGGLFAIVNEGQASYLLARSETGYIPYGVLGSLVTIAVLALVVLILRHVGLGLFRFMLAAAVFTIGIAAVGLLTVRHYIAMMVLGVCAHVYYRNPALSRKLIPLMLIGFIGGAIVLEAVRTQGGVPDAAEINARFLGESAYLEWTAHIIRESERKGFLYGTHLIDVPMFLVPRSLWPEKPVTSTMNRRFWPELADIGAEKLPGIVGEGYATAGLLGVFCFAFVLGIAVRKANDWVQSTCGNELKYVLLTATLTGWAYSSVRVGLFGKQFLTFAIMLGQTALLLRCGQSSEPAGVSSTGASTFGAATNPENA
jgi:hypothetical protein